MSAEPVREIATQLKPPRGRKVTKPFHIKPTQFMPAGGSEACDIVFPRPSPPRLELVKSEVSEVMSE